MNERPATSPRSAAELLCQAAEVLWQAAREATPGSWRWGDPDVGGGGLEQYCSTLEPLPGSTPFPAGSRTQTAGEPVLLGLRDPLEVFEEALQPTQSHVPATARWIVLGSPLLAEPLATFAGLTGTAPRRNDRSW